MQLATLLATTLNVNFGITDLDFPWLSPMTTPRKLKAMIISRTSKRKQCLKVSAVFTFWCLRLIPSLMLAKKWTQLLSKTGYGCTDWALYSGKSSWIRSKGGELTSECLGYSPCTHNSGISIFYQNHMRLP